MVPETFAGLHMNILAMVDSQRRLVYTGAYDRSLQGMTIFPASLVQVLDQLSEPVQANSNTLGIIALPEGLLLAASRPIISGREERPVRGAVLDVARVSFWRFTPDGAQIECEELYDAGSGAYRSGACLAAHAYPAYLQGLAVGHLNAANDARRDERTREFNERYLKLHGITSMLDAPVRLHGQLEGIVCCEHTGAPRVWTLEEQEFMAGVEDLMALACETAERQRVEDMLRENERRLRLAQEFGRIGTWDWDLRSGHDLWSDVTKEIFGVPGAGDEIVCMDYVHPHDCVAVERAIQDCIDRGIAYNIEHRIVRPDGGVRWVAERGNVVRDEHGAPVRMLGMSMDITERKMAEAALSAEKELLAVTLCSMSDAVGRPLNGVFCVCTEDTRTRLTKLGWNGWHMISTIF